MRYLIATIMTTALFFTAVDAGFPRDPGADSGVKAGSDAPPTKVSLDVRGIIRMILERNLDLRKATLDYVDADADHGKFEGQYDIYAYGKAFDRYRQLSPDDPAVATEGYRVGQTGFEGGLQKYFSTGTTLSAGVTTMQQNIRTPVAGAGMTTMKGYSSVVGIRLSQELFKNAFGENDRLTERNLLKSTEIKRREAQQAVADVIMKSFVSYWNYVIADENLKTAEIAYRNTGEVRNLVKRKASTGISEKEELYDWESRVLQAKNYQDGAALGLLNARLEILRTLDLAPGTDVEIVQNLSDSAPSENVEAALAEAVKGRADIRNMKSYTEILENNLEIAKGNARPSLTASGGYGYNGYSPDRYRKSYGTDNLQWSISITVSSPLEGTYDKAVIESARSALEKNRIALKQLENGIRDEIRILISKCEAAYRIYRQTSQSSKYAKSYYDQVYRRFSQGRYETTQLKMAFDNYIMLRNNALQSLVDYNVAILELDIAKNAVFRKYAIDIDGVLDKKTR